MGQNVSSGKATVAAPATSTEVTPLAAESAALASEVAILADPVTVLEATVKTSAKEDSKAVEGIKDDTDHADSTKRDLKPLVVKDNVNPLPAVKESPSSSSTVDVQSGTVAKPQDDTNFVASFKVDASTVAPAKDDKAHAIVKKDPIPSLPIEVTTSSTTGVNEPPDIIPVVKGETCSLPILRSPVKPIPAVGNNVQPHAMVSGDPYKPPKNGKCCFFIIAGEIRNQVYEEVFSTPIVVKLRPKPLRHKYTYPRQEHYNEFSMWSGSPVRYMHKMNWKNCLSGIILANKQTFHEAAAIMYESVTFSFERPGHTSGFLKTVSTPLLAHIRSIRFEHDFQIPYTSPAAEQCLKQRCQEIAQSLPALNEIAFAVSDLRLRLKSVLPGMIHGRLSIPNSPKAAQSALETVIGYLQPFQQCKTLKSARVEMPWETVESVWPDILSYESVVGFTAVAGNADQQKRTLAENYLYARNALLKAVEQIFVDKVFGRPFTFEKYRVKVVKFRQWGQGDVLIHPRRYGM